MVGPPRRKSVRPVDHRPPVEGSLPDARPSSTSLCILHVEAVSGGARLIAAGAGLTSADFSSAPRSTGLKPTLVLGAAMKISELLSPSDVLVNVPASNKQLLLRDLASKAANNLGLDVDQIAPYLLKREEFGSTGIGRGAAIPHALLPDLQRPFGLMAKLKQPIEFDAIDSQAVDLVFLLLLPERTDNRHLSALAIVARVLRRIDVLDQLRSARDTCGIYSAMAAASEI